MELKHNFSSIDLKINESDCVSLGKSVSIVKINTASRPTLILQEFLVDT